MPGWPPVEHDDAQNDIIGGNSDLFGLGGTCTAANENYGFGNPAGSCKRPSGSNLIFGGSGTQLDREGFGDTSPQGHANNSDVIVAQNGEIIRLVGTDHNYGVGDNGVAVAPSGFLKFNYDNYTASLPLAQQAWIVVRGVSLLDYTPGGPDLANQPGPLVSGDIGGNTVPANAAAGITTGTLQRGSEIHAEAGDAFIYGGPADDVIFGGGQNDTIITGYGDNWVSGGRGDACIIGGGGRCFASRDSSSYGEPLYGIDKIPAGQISELITTPGNVQQAVINQQNAIKYTSLLYPYNWDPTSSGGTLPTFSTGCKQNQLCPHYQPRFGHNIIYGGWGGGVIHGGPGQSALSGSEAPGALHGTVFETAYTNNYNLNGDQLNAAPIQSDWYHPFNPGNPMGWVPLGANLHGNAGRATQIGKAVYFNTEDPRRKIMLNGDGTNCIWAAGSTWQSCAFNWFLNFDPTDPALPLDTKWFQGTTCSNGAQCPSDPVTGDKAIFGDLGNDWIVAGMGRVRVYGGWGNDVIDVRASMNVDGGLNDGPVPNPDGVTFGTPAWESLAYGGAGQDILFAGTGGDRLIDWVGNHNSFYVPFSQFGMPAVSRTLQPFLPEFLYALSKSDGADPTLGIRYGGVPARNGEPFGELSLVLQHDDAWHQQVGPPFNEMPENLGGTGIDVMKTANVRPFLSPGTDPPAGSLTARVSLPSGVGVNLPSGTNTPGSSAVPLYVTGAPGASVSYTFTEGAFTTSGTGVLNQKGVFGASVDVSTFPDGTIIVTVTLTGGGAATTTLMSTMGKNSVPPPPPGVSVPVFANIANSFVYTLTIAGQVGSIANVVMTDAGTPLPNVANGMDVIGSTGTLSLPRT